MPKIGLRAHVLEFRDEISCYKLLERAIFNIFMVLTLDRSQFTFKR